jgi:hypothetical protein
LSDAAYFSATALSIVLVVSAWNKLRSPARFRAALGTFKTIPALSIPTLVVAVPGAELLVAGLQWVPSLRPWIGVVAIAMLVAFTLLLLHSLLSGEHADCGCFGSVAPEKVSWFSIVRNVVLIGFAVIGVVVGDGASRGALPATLSGAGAGLLVLVLDQLGALWSKTSYEPGRMGG